MLLVNDQISQSADAFNPDLHHVPSLHRANASGSSCGDDIPCKIAKAQYNRAILQSELDRRREEARNADPVRACEGDLQREQLRLQKNIDRLVTAYQQELVSLEELRARMPDLRRQQKAAQTELQCLQMASEDRSRYLRLEESLQDFRSRLCARADEIDVVGRQTVLRLLVKEILVGNNQITIRHSISLPHLGSGPNPSLHAADVPLPSTSTPFYLLRTWHRNPG